MTEGDHAGEDDGAACEHFGFLGADEVDHGWLLNRRRRRRGLWFGAGLHGVVARVPGGVDVREDGVNTIELVVVIDEDGMRAVRRKGGGRGGSDGGPVLEAEVVAAFVESGLFSSVELLIAGESGTRAALDSGAWLSLELPLLLSPPATGDGDVSELPLGVAVPDREAPVLPSFSSNACCILANGLASLCSANLLCNFSVCAARCAAA